MSIQAVAPLVIVYSLPWECFGLLNSLYCNHQFRVSTACLFQINLVESSRSWTESRARQTWWQFLCLKCDHLRQKPCALWQMVAQGNPWGWGTSEISPCANLTLSVLDTEPRALFMLSRHSPRVTHLAPCRNFCLLGFRNNRLKGGVSMRSTSFFHCVFQLRLELELDISTHPWFLSWGKAGEKVARTPPSQEQSLDLWWQGQSSFNLALLA